MMTGEFHNVIDEKGRLLIPARLRSEIASQTIVITHGMDKALWLFPPEEWRVVSDGLMAAASPFDRKARMIQRRIIGAAQEIEIDKAGRINIPPSLQDDAGLRRECVILGIKRYIEVWDADTYRAYLDATEEEYQEAAEELGGRVFF